MELLMREIARNHNHPFGCAAEHEAIEIAAVLHDVRLHPSHRRRQVLVRSGPSMLGSQAIVDVDADHALPGEPQQLSPGSQAYLARCARGLGGGGEMDAG